MQMRERVSGSWTNKSITDQMLLKGELMISMTEWVG